VLQFAKGKMAEGGFASINDWLGKWKSEEGKKEAPSLYRGMLC